MIAPACAQRSAPDLGTAAERGATGGEETVATDEPEEGPGRLTARPRRDVTGNARTGLFELEVGDGRKPLLFVPDGYDARKPAPFALTLHGANAGAPNGMKRLLPYAEERGLILLAVASRDRTWDVVLGGFGADVEHVDAALDEVFSRYAIDRRRLAVQGFSDGASYALSLGITNGDLFSHVIAFSAGFMAPDEARGSPLVYASHGTTDPILPIGSTSRRYVPQLRRAGYDVTYTEFEGGHRTPQYVATEAVEWFLNGVGGDRH
ncbi:MAG TPA: phospholipase [Actinomycetota bacterium]|nr:phospholipase [Actinomycetota bacterium]